MAAPEHITVSDLRRLGYCAAGQRQWFKDNGMDFMGFIKHGLPTADFLAQGDALAQEAVDRLTQESGNG